MLIVDITKKGRKFLKSLEVGQSLKQSELLAHNYPRSFIAVSSDKIVVL